MNKKIVITSYFVLMVVFVSVFKTKSEGFIIQSEQEISIGMSPASQSLSDNSITKCIEPEIPEYVKVISQSYYAPISLSETTTMYDIELSDELQEYTIGICEEYEVDPVMVFAIMGCESEYQADVISKTSDYGLMQINICNHKSLGKVLDIKDFLDAKSNILAGVYILSTIQASCNDIEKQLMCYNLGINGAKKYWNKGIESNIYTQKVIARMEAINIRKE